MNNAFNKDRLYAENQDLKERITELEGENQVLSDLLRSETMRSEAHDLEQQANSLYWVISHDSGVELSGSACYKLFNRMVELREQAKQLKAQDDG